MAGHGKGAPSWDGRAGLADRQDTNEIGAVLFRIPSTVTCRAVSNLGAHNFFQRGPRGPRVGMPGEQGSRGVITASPRHWNPPAVIPAPPSLANGASWLFLHPHFPRHEVDASTTTTAPSTDHCLTTTGGCPFTTTTASPPTTGSQQAVPGSQYRRPTLLIYV